MANKVLGMHRLKNKVNRNAFDLSHRHMFTAQVGELLPVFTQWVNPNETFKSNRMGNYSKENIAKKAQRFNLCA
jgi:hypothetical protein